MSLQIVMYHYVRNIKYGRYKNIKGFDIDEFCQQLDFFVKNFNIIKMEDLLNAVYKNVKLPGNALLLTFDDGYSDHFNTVFPILLNLGLQGSFFIPAQNFIENKLMDVNKVHFVLASANIEELYNETISQIQYYCANLVNVPPIEELKNKYQKPNRFDDEKTVFVKRMLQTVLPENIRGIIAGNLFKKYVCIEEDVFAKELYLNKHQIKCMKEQGMFIGLHGYNHYWIGNLQKDEQEREIVKSLQSMEEFIDKDNWVMNYPYGSYNQDTINIIKKFGCKLALTTIFDICDLSKYNKYELPRLDAVDYPPRSNNYKNYEVKYESSIR